MDTKLSQNSNDKNTDSNHVDTIVDTAGTAIVLGVLQYIFQQERKSPKIQNADTE